jgi:hypothetical protein
VLLAPALVFMALTSCTCKKKDLRATQGCALWMAVWVCEGALSACTELESLNLLSLNLGLVEENR